MVVGEKSARHQTETNTPSSKSPRWIEQAGFLQHYHMATIIRPSAEYANACKHFAVLEK
jgi:hypothetical protein